MAKLLEQAIAKLRKLPSARQDEAAELVLSVVEQEPETIHLSETQVAEVERRLSKPTEYTTHADVRAFFEKRGV